MGPTLPLGFRARFPRSLLSLEGKGGTARSLVNFDKVEQSRYTIIAFGHSSQIPVALGIMSHADSETDTIRFDSRRQTHK